jgi:hypothetical protein
MKKFVAFLFIISFLIPASYARHERDWSVHVVFHQDKYYPGDTAFFKVWLLDENFKPSEGVLILRIDLINNLGQVAVSQNFKIKDGEGNNQIKLPEEMKDGAYISNVSVYGSAYHSSCGQLIVSGEKSFNQLNDRDSVGPLKSSLIELRNLKPNYKTREKVDITLQIDQEKIGQHQLAVRVFSAKAQYTFKESSGNESLVPRPVKPATRILMKGRIVRKNSNEAVPDSTHVAIFLIHAQQGYDFYTRKNGQFEVSIIQDFYADDKVFVMAQFGGKELPVDLQLEEAPDNITQIKAPLLTPSFQDDQYTDFVISKRDVEKSFHFFSSLDSAVTPRNDVNQLEKKFQGADISVKIEDYLIFPTMEDIVREIIPTLFISKTKSETKIGMNLWVAPEKIAASKNNPLIIIDGVVTKDANYFLNLKPSDIISVKLVRKLYKLVPLGVLGENGIIIVSTKNTKIANELLRSMATVNGLTKGIPYFSKTHSQNENPRLPDLRLSLCWNPQVTLGSDGHAAFSFFTSDALGEFVVQVFGINKNGEVYRVSNSFQVTR